jgi:hypothetical protein
MAPGPSIVPAPAPTLTVDRHGQVKNFVQTLLLYGGYNELADILVNLTSLATEMGQLVSKGYMLTVLAHNGEAMAWLVRSGAMGLRTWRTYFRIRDGTWSTPYTSCNYSYRSRTS